MHGIDILALQETRTHDDEDFVPLGCSYRFVSIRGTAGGQYGVAAMLSPRASAELVSRDTLVEHRVMRLAMKSKLEVHVVYAPAAGKYSKRRLTATEKFYDDYKRLLQQQDQPQEPREMGELAGAQERRGPVALGRNNEEVFSGVQQRRPAHQSSVAVATHATDVPVAALEEDNRTKPGDPKVRRLTRKARTACQPRPAVRRILGCNKGGRHKEVPVATHPKIPVHPASELAENETAQRMKHHPCMILMGDFNADIFDCPLFADRQCATTTSAWIGLSPQIRGNR